MAILEPRHYVGKYVAKRVRIDELPSYWKFDFSNEWSVQYHEAQRLARAGDIAGLFVYEACHERGVSVYGKSHSTYTKAVTEALVQLRTDHCVTDIRFAPTYIVTSSNGVGWITQKVLSGEKYPSEEDAQDTSLLARTLGAFSHYAIQRHGLYFDSHEGMCPFII